MYALRKLCSHILCFTLSSYGVPVFAMVAQTSAPDKAELSDAQMAATIGGSLHTEILTDGEAIGSPVRALVAVNASCCAGFDYTLESIDSFGNVVRTMASGTLNANQARVISGTRQNGDYLYRVKMTFVGVPDAVVAQDARFKL